MQTSRAIASALNVVQTSHSYGDIMLLEKALESNQVSVFSLIFIECNHSVSFVRNCYTKYQSAVIPSKKVQSSLLFTT